MDKEKQKELQDKVVENRALAIEFKDYPDDKFYLELVSGRRVRTMITRVGSMVLPVITAYLEESGEYQAQLSAYNKMLEDEEAPVVDAPNMSLVGIAAIVSRELTNPELDYIMDELLEGLYTFTGDKVDLDEGFEGKRAAIIMLITELAIRENILIPLVQWLENKGLTGIDTFLQQLSSNVKEVVQGMS